MLELSGYGWAILRAELPARQPPAGCCRRWGSEAFPALGTALFGCTPALARQPGGIASGERAARQPPPTAAGAAGFAKGEHAEANPVGALRSADTRASARQAPSRIGRRRRKKLRSRAFPRPSRGAPRQRWSKAIPIRPGGGPTEPQASCGGRPRALTFPCIPWTRHRKSCRRCAASR